MDATHTIPPAGPADASRAGDGHAGCRPPSKTEAHCTVCHRTFSGVGYFDTHRRAGSCLDPAGMGLVEVDQLWTTAVAHATRASRREQIAGVRARRGHTNGP